MEKVTAVSSSGNFNIFSIALQSDDLFPDLAGQAGNASSISQPGVVNHLCRRDVDIIEQG